MARRDEESRDEIDSGVGGMRRLEGGSAFDANCFCLPVESACRLIEELTVETRRVIHDGKHRFVEVNWAGFSRNLTLMIYERKGEGR